MADLKECYSSGNTAKNNSGDENSLKFMGDDENESEHTRRICIYLHNLQNRLKQGVAQHTDLVQKSVRLLKEVNDVSTTLALAKSGSNNQKTKIKRLIMEFESGCATPGQEDLMELRDLLADFEKLHENQLLQESLLNFKRAGDSFEKVYAFLETVGLGNNTSPHPSPQPSQLMTTQSTNRSLRERIEAFNKSLELGTNISQDFVRCFSSHCSLENSEKITSQSKLPNIGSRTNSGYEGDVDSEIELAENEALAETEKQ
ncbi:uncharacterized protein Dwil_GK12159 [Drosophila willistoni]|uniref:Uncharacterized protein n=1 Tax=Drosophila willistoni TaxID=7260 RepID=B4N954_DROWI|nr:uncharacterized protein LOC6647199 [Drosophila willistoni]EDW81601.1 uncharacterized protein Dwil_GK12159 [Drosophila willistoni]